MHGTVVGVLRGGSSREHEISLATGQAILTNLSLGKYTLRDIYIDRTGMWHTRGLPTTPGKVLPGIDVAIIALHGGYGEDGEVQKILERFNIPFTGSDSFTSFVAMHKVMAKEKAKEAGIRVPQYRYIENEKDIEESVHEIIRTFQQPVIVKPVRGGSSLGVTLTGGYQHVHQAVIGLFTGGEHGVLVEEYVRGKEATVGVLEGMRGEALYALPAVEIVPHASSPFFNYESKYAGKSEQYCPGRFSKASAEEMSAYARKIHQELGLRHYSRSDFIVSPRGVYYLETNSLPGLYTGATFLHALDSVGIAHSELLSHLIALALDGRKR